MYIKIPMHIAYTQFFKEDFRHPVVEVLSGVKNELLMAVPPQCSGHGRQFHELGASADYLENFHSENLRDLLDSIQHPILLFRTHFRKHRKAQAYICGFFRIR